MYGKGNKNLPFPCEKHKGQTDLHMACTIIKKQALLAEVQQYHFSISQSENNTTSSLK
jgi:hypothetical protein